MKTETTIPQRASIDAHRGRRIKIDAWARDFGGRLLPGNGWCADCGVPVAVTVERPGIFKKLEPATP